MQKSSESEDEIQISENENDQDNESIDDCDIQDVILDSGGPPI